MFEDAGKAMDRALEVNELAELPADSL